MKKMKFLTAGLIAAMMVPAAAQAQTRDIREDRRDAREERRELRDAQRYGARGDVREERREYRDELRGLGEARRNARNDRRCPDYRAHPRSQHSPLGSSSGSNDY